MSIKNERKYRIDDLQFNGLRLMQDPDAFCFGCDAVELANFVKGSTNDKACDLGAGNGIISVLLAAKRGCSVTAIELQSEAAQLCQRNAELNSLSNQIQVENIAMQDYIKTCPKGRFDIVVTNPPYQRLYAGENSCYEAIAIARHEVKVTLREVIECAAHLVKFGGKFYMVYPVVRLSEVLTLCTKFKLEPKVLQILTPCSGKSPHLFLLECLSGGKHGLNVLPERVINTSV